MKHFSLLIILFFSGITVGTCRPTTGLKTLVARYKELIHKEHPTKSTQQQLANVQENLTPFIEEVIAELENELVNKEASDCSDDEASSASEEHGYDDLTSSSQELLPH